MKSDDENKMTSGSALLHDNTITPKDDRRARGKVLSGKIPRKLHGEWKPDVNRPNPLEILSTSDQGRIPELAPIRYGRMSRSPFTFLRGAAAIMAYDLSTSPTTEVNVQACGDCHALNFGAFATPERKIVFDINDFDETLPGPWEWDLKRLAASLMLIARDNELKEKVGSVAAESAARAYREHMEKYSHMAIFDVWYANFDWQSVLDQADTGARKSLQSQLKKAQKKSIAGYYFPKMTENRGGTHVIKDSPPLIFHLEDNEKFFQEMKEGLDLYRQSLQEDRQRLLERYKLIDVAIKVVGIGSVGTTCAVALLLSPGSDDEPMFLQLKEARASVLEDYSGASQYENHGQRVVAGQRIMQSASDICLGWMKLTNGKHFYVRQLRDTKIKFLPEEWDANQLIAMAEVMGGVLARAHARSGDSAVISGYLGNSEEFDLAIAEFARRYADQSERDFAVLEQAIAAGKIKITVEAD